MKALIWTDGFWPRIGGTETQTLQFVLGMHERGHECLVLAQKDEQSWKEDELYQKIPIKRFDFNSLIERKNLKNLRPIQEYLTWVVKIFQPEIVYLNTFSGGSALAFLLFRNMLKVPVIGTIHAPYYWNSFPSIVEKICSQVDTICCGSKWGLSVMKGHLPPSFTNKLRLIYYGISMPNIKPTPLPFSLPTILILCRLSFEKGVDTAIEAFSLLKKRGSDAQLLIAGEGTERPYLEHLVNQLSLQNCVEFTGALTRNEVPLAINRATFVIMPSHFEAFGLSALESMLMNRPVIASKVGGLPEFISHGQTGLLIPTQDPLSLCNAMEFLLKQPQEIVKMGERAKKSVIGKFTLEKYLDEYEAISQCNYCRL